ncbi:protein O-mannosyl-transferase TMTC4-like [Actinia tenebrosa]|uniref:Protein O-mannosyl-transferase TMTC4-like n=1 Tax=Actinia tenebrosa TaxID=6105 RepID=A0A6P8IPT3_ACTTE|nr:protein O-mannosyl-transferase TMTC4-like [Actinia tenebrosa]
MRVRPKPIGNGFRRKTLKDSEEFDKWNRPNGECKTDEGCIDLYSLDEHLTLPSLTNRTASILLSTVSIICYWNSCNGDFVFDDSEAIVGNKDLRPDTPFWKLFLHDFWGGTLTSNDSHKSYRPLTVLTYRWNYWLAGGLHPWGFHFVNVILHAVVSCLSLLVFNEVFSEKQTQGGKVSKTGFLCALLFTIHPIHTESVAGVVGRADLLSGLCFFLSFLTYAKCCKLHFIVPFLPASNIFFRVGFVIAERVLYLSSVGSCILVVLGIAALSRRAYLRKYVACCMFTMIVCFTLWTIKRSGEWVNEDLLFSSGEAVCPLNAKVHYNIGKVRSNQHRDEEALRYYREAIRLNPTYHDALNNLGNLLKDKGEINEAEELLEKAVKSSNTFAAGWMNLGTVKAAMNKMEEAEVCYKNAIKFRKKYPDAYFNLGNLYIDWEKGDEAIAAFENAVRLNKNHVGAWLNHILLLDKSEKRKEGIALAREALKYIPRESSIHFNLGNMLGQEKLFEEAEKHFLKAIKINPRVAEIEGNLGVLYHRWGKLDEAERQYHKALKLDPHGANIRENIEKLKRTKQRLKQ